MLLLTDQTTHESIKVNKHVVSMKRCSLQNVARRLSGHRSFPSFIKQALIHPAFYGASNKILDSEIEEYLSLPSSATGLDLLRV